MPGKGQTTMVKRITFTRLMAFVCVLALAGLFAWSNLGANASPGKASVEYRVAAITRDSKVVHEILLKQVSRTMVDTTPVNGSTVCITGDAKQFAAQLTLTGTLGGTNPVLTVVLQQSIDGGTTWRNVGTSFAAINATTTPTGGREDVAFSDVAASTAITFGDCYRARYTWAGSGTVTGNVGVSLIAK